MLGFLKTAGEKDMWVHRLADDMHHTEQVYSSYQPYYTAFRKIRHDFANYVQTLQLFEPGEEASEANRLRRNILSQVQALCAAMEAETSRILSGTVLQTQSPSFQEFEQMGACNAQRFQRWLCRKAYFLQLQNELPGIYQSLCMTAEKLSYSLPPSIPEATGILDEMDSFRASVPVDNLILAALISDIACMCREKEISFRYRAEVPEAFSISMPDLFYLYDCLLSFAVQRSKPGNGAVISFKTAERFGLWHLKLTYESDADKDAQTADTITDAMFASILHTYAISMKQKTNEKQTEIDLIR